MYLVRMTSDPEILYARKYLGIHIGTSNTPTTSDIPNMLLDYDLTLDKIINQATIGMQSMP